MANSSIFRQFIGELKKRWRVEYPSIQPVDKARGFMAAASTFCAGVTVPSGMLAYLHFQHASKAWKVGQFTINVGLARTKDEEPIMGFPPDEGPISSGVYRVGS